MSVSKVSASVLDSSVDLGNYSQNKYKGTLTAPEFPGKYSVFVYADDKAGNVSLAESEFTVALWHTPKTDWVKTDRFNITDYNRIKNNLIYLYQVSAKLQRNYSFPDMGDDLMDYSSWWDVDKFNLFETNLELINQHIFTQDYGVAQKFFENGVFIKWDELNRIESATLAMNEILERQKAGLRKIGFRLGRFKEVRT